MLQAIHDWAAKSKLNMTLLMALVAAIGVAATAYLPAATATLIIKSANNIVVCGDLACTTSTTIPAPVAQ